MTKRILIAVGSLLFAALILLLFPVSTANPNLNFLPTGTTTGTAPTRPTGSTTTAPETRPTAPTTPPTSSTAPTITLPPVTVPTEPSTNAPTTTLPPPPGQVRLYACDEALLESYAKLAVEYYTASGIEVILLAPGEGESCSDALARYMASDAPPTMFCVHDAATLQQYAHRLQDLSGTAAAGKLYSSNFGMYSGNKLVALPVEVDWFGYIYNTALLGDASFSRVDFFRPDMTSYSSMEYITEYITSQKNNLGAYPFGQPNLTDTSQTGLAYLLSTVFRDPTQLRSFIDLYCGNSRTTVNALTSFQNSRIVFLAGSTATFDGALTLGIDKLELLPAFVDGSTAMHYTCDHFWAVTGSGYAPDIAETMAFLDWMVTASEDAAAPIDSLGLLSPYRDAAAADNALEKLLRKYMAEEPVKLLWNSSCVADEDLEAFGAALNAYYLKPNNTNWAVVEALMKKLTA